MAIADNYAPQSTQGNGATDVFTGNWTPISATFFKCDLELISTGVRTPQVQGINYTLAFDDSGYSITMTTPPSNLYNVIRYRETEQDQDVSYTTSQGFQGKVTENSFDKLTAMVQEQQDAVARSLKTQLASGVTGLTIATPLVDGELLEYEATGTKVQSSGYSVADIATAVSDAEAAQVAAEAAQTAAELAETNAEIAETNAESAAIASAVSAASAAAAAAGGLYGNVESKSFADSPIVPLLTEEGTLYRIDTTGGAVVVNLSALSVYGEDVKFAFVRVAGSNPVTINRGGSDTINGGTSVVISGDYVVNVLVGDFESSSWTNSIQASTVADGDYGDVTVADGGATWTINDDVVTNAKILDDAVTPAKLDRDYVSSVTTGVTGADVVTNTMSLTAAEYAAIGSKNASTLYIITDA